MSKKVIMKNVGAKWWLWFGVVTLSEKSPVSLASLAPLFSVGLKERKANALTELVSMIFLAHLKEWQTV
jgi:hypothetical protein